MNREEERSNLIKAFKNYSVTRFEYMRYVCTYFFIWHNRPYFVNYVTKKYSPGYWDNNPYYQRWFGCYPTKGYGDFFGGGDSHKKPGYSYTDPDDLFQKLAKYLDIDLLAAS